MKPRRVPSLPLVRIDISKTASHERVRDVGNAVYNAMIAVANVPQHDRFQVVTRHEPDEIIYPEQGYLGIDYTPDLIIIQVTWVGGRSTEVKKKFYHHIADEIHAKQGVRKQDIWISLVDSGREDVPDCPRPSHRNRRAFSRISPRYVWQVPTGSTASSLIDPCRCRPPDHRQ